MSSLGDLAVSQDHELLTLREAAEVLRIGRSLGYQFAHQYLNSGGTSGLPVVVLGEKCFRVPGWALMELVTTGRAALTEWAQQRGLELQPPTPPQSRTVSRGAAAPQPPSIGLDIDF